MVQCDPENIEDRKCVERFVNCIVTDYDNSVKSVRLGEKILRQSLFSVLFNVPLSSESSKLVNKAVMQRAQCAAMASKDFMCLSNKLQTILLVREKNTHSNMQ